MNVFTWIKGRDLSVEASGRDHRDLALKLYKAFQNRWRTCQRVKCLRQVRAFGQTHLTFAVIAKTSCLQDARQPNLLGCRLQRGEIGYIRIRRRGQPKLGQKVLFDQAILADPQRFAAWAYGNNCLDQVQRLGRDVLKLIGDDVNRTRKGLKRACVLVRCGCNLCRHLSRRCVFARLKNVTAKAKARCRHGQHPPQLAPAKDADCCAGVQPPTHRAARPELRPIGWRANRPAAAPARDLKAREYQRP